MWPYEDFPARLHDAAVAEDLSQGQILMQDLREFLASKDGDARKAIIASTRIAALNASTPVPQEWRHPLEHFLDRLSWPD